ncbi:MAG: alpha-isopropylmalate synthase regulatory domain-containing protein, partial [Mucinivorans sp.]
IDASINALRTIIKEQCTLQEFLIQAMTRGSDDTGRVHVTLESDGVYVHGFATHTDIVMAGVEAYIDGVNKLL